MVVIEVGHSTRGDYVADLPTCLYLPVLVGKSAGSTEVRPNFSKYRHRVSRKYRNRDVNDASSLPAKPIIEQ